MSFDGAKLRQFSLLANDKMEDLTIKKLTKNNPTMRDRFEELHSNQA